MQDWQRRREERTVYVVTGESDISLSLVIFATRDDTHGHFFACIDLKYNNKNNNKNNIRIIAK